MKRSDIVQLIYRHIYTTYGEDTPGCTRKLAEEILKDIEAAGMLPPGYHSVLKNIWGNKVGETFTCKWEPEGD